MMAKLNIAELVHCRIGSLEMHKQILKLWVIVHCRIGSLEAGENAGQVK